MMISADASVARYSEVLRNPQVPNRGSPREASCDAHAVQSDTDKHASLLPHRRDVPLPDRYPRHGAPTSWSVMDNRFFPLVVVPVMLALGLTLTVADFRRAAALRRPLA